MTTESIQETLIRSASNLISETSPNYQYVAARLMSFDLRKRVYESYTPWPLKRIVERAVADGFYTAELLEWYSDEDFEALDRIVRHERDDLIPFAGMNQMREKYLVKNKLTRRFYETPQITFLLIPATLHHAHPERLKLIKEDYNALSLFDVTLPTPIMAGVRTPLKQFSSCTLIDVGDSLDSINAAAAATVKYGSQRAGIGLNIGRIRAVGSPIRNGDVVHTGVTPFLKYLTAALKSCNQGGIRNVSATVHWPVWHYEFETLIELKNNKGTEATRERAVDYSVQLSGLFYRRLLEDGQITFFSPSDVPGLYEAFFRDQEEFERLYLAAEKKRGLRKKTLPALEVFSKILQERVATGRIYIQHVDHANTYGAFDSSKAPIYMSNLCQEIEIPTKPMDLVDEMIGLCTLGAINFGNIRQPGDFERPAKILVRLLNAILDYQDYPVEAARRGVELYRNLGIGISNLAYFLAKHNFKYSSPDVLEWLQPFLETFSYYIIKASADLAEKDGACSGFQNTNYARGLLPALNYKKELDEVVPHQLLLDWESLKEKVMRTGLRNASLMACMPVESSSLPSNATNGIDPPRNLISIKASKDGAVKQVVPEISRLKNKYEFMFDHPSTKGYLGICGLISKFIDQSISTNTTYQPASFEGGEIPLSVLLSDLIYAYNLGVHTLYYNNVDDGSGEVDVKSVAPLAQDSAEESQENCEACVV